MRQHLLAAQQATGHTPEQLNTPALPLGMAYLLLWFRQLASRRGQGFEAPPPIGWTEIAHWAALMRVSPQPWELQALTRLDDLWLGAWRRGRPKTPATGRKSGGGR